MRIIHHVKKENSGLFRTVGELAKYEERAGHQVSLRTPAEKKTFYGFADDNCDIHCIHSQINPDYFRDNKPKMLFLHGEPDYGMLNKISVQAIMDLAPTVDAFISLNKDEATLWGDCKRTYVITKGIDLEKYKPVSIAKKFIGAPSVIYAEHWRGFRHPFHALSAMARVRDKIKDARFYGFGCPDTEKAFWLRLIRNNHYNTFTPGIFKHQNSQSALFCMADIIVSPVFPSYGRVSLEAKACNRPVIAYNTNPHADYKCKPYDPDDMAEKIIQCWKEKPNHQREYAEKYLSAKIMADEAIKIYQRFL